MTRSSIPAWSHSPMLTLGADRELVRAEARSRRYLLATVGAPEAPPRTESLPVNIALVLDRSGSMSSEAKFPLAVKAVEQALAMLHPEDRFSLVVFDDEVDVLAHSRTATPIARREALQALHDVGPRGCTNLSGGWLRGCEQVAESLSDRAISRALLLTDGLANSGITDHAELAHHAGELRRRGIVTSTFGVGNDFDERLLRDMAHEGGGNFYFISSPAQIADLLTSELGEALHVVMRRSALHVVLPVGVTARPLNRYRHTIADGSRDFRVEIGDLTSGQELQVVFELTFPRGEPGDATSVFVALQSEEPAVTHVEEHVRWTFAGHRENDTQPRDVTVDREVARIYAALARAEATEANRRGDMEHARRIIDGTARRIRSYSHNDGELQEIASELRSMRADFVESRMSVYELKTQLYVAEMGLKSRGRDGKARRLPTPDER